MKVSPLQLWCGSVITYGIWLTLCLTGHTLVLALWLIVEIGVRVWGLSAVLEQRNVGR